MPEPDPAVGSRTPRYAERPGHLDHLDPPDRLDRLDRLDHLLVDARPVDHPTARQRGIGRYVTGLLAGLTAIEAPFTALVGSSVEAEVLADVVAPERLVPWSPQAVRRHARPGTWYLATQLMLHPVSLDPIPRPITRARIPVAAVMYDVIPYRHPDRYQTVPAARRLHQLRAPLARTVDALLAISDFAADTAGVELGVPRDRIVTIGAGVEPQFLPPAVDRRPPPTRVLPADVGDYVVSVTGGDERKNTEGLLRAWAELSTEMRARHRLVVVAAHDVHVLRRWRTWAEDAGVAEDVVFTGAVTDDEMVALLQGARLAVMPSIEEGFGLPVLEAVACGCPAICSGVSSLPEVLDEPAACFDPHDPTSIARAIDRGLTDETHRAVLSSAGRRAVERWTWPSVARATVDALGALGPRFPGGPRTFARTIGLAGPYEGSESGIGPYDARIADALDRRLTERGDELVRLVDLTGTADGSDAAAPTGRRWPVRAIGRFVPPWDLDHLVVALGSSHHHVAAAQLAATRPCHVWLHEATLVGVHVGLAHLSGSPTWSEQHLRAALVEDLSSGGRAAVGADSTGATAFDPLGEAPTSDELLDPAWWADQGLTLLGGVLDRARSVIVSSERALELVRRVRPDGPPALVLPLAYPDTAPAPAPAPGSPAAGAPTIVSLGWLDDSKLPDVAVAALAELRRRPGLGDARLVFVGATVGDTAQRIERLADHLGLGGSVEITGRLDEESYRDRLGHARAGLQLRRADRGEMSAAVTDLLAAGIPVVTNLVTAGAPDAGLAVVELPVTEGGGDEVLVRAAGPLADALAPLLVDDAVHAAATTAALDRARAWTADHVADVLLGWLDRFDGSDGVEGVDGTGQ